MNKEIRSALKKFKVFELSRKEVGYSASSYAYRKFGYMGSRKQKFPWFEYPFCARSFEDLTGIKLEQGQQIKVKLVQVK